MQIVIDIPDGYVKVIMANQRTEGSTMDKLIRQAVIDGTPLPKGHGDLVDADAVLEDPIGDTYKDLEVAETIIPADTESEE